MEEIIEKLKQENPDHKFEIRINSLFIDNEYSCDLRANDVKAYLSGIGMGLFLARRKYDKRPN